jgi:hypothetical protein
MCGHFRWYARFFKLDGGVYLSEPWFRKEKPAIAMTLVASFGAIGFLHLFSTALGSLDIYMLTQAAGWGIVPDYLAVFKPSSYRWLVPALNDPTEASQMSMTLGAVLLYWYRPLRTVDS